MRKPWTIVLLLVAGVASLLLVARVASIGVALPHGRLDRELAAARREGLWTKWSDIAHDARGVSEGQNAAPLIRRAIALQKRLPEVGAWDVAARPFLKGTATPAQVALLRRDLATHPAITAAWRAASARPRTDYGRRWEDGAATLFPEYSDLKRGVRRLAVAARLGERPRENLLAAARLADLTRREPVIIASLVGVAMGKITLREARHEGLARAVEAALGPPIDVRRAYAAELPFALDVMRNEGAEAWEERMGVRQKSSSLYRLAHGEPMRSNETEALVHDWRGLWRDLGSGTDYPTAAKAMRRWMQGIERRQADWSVIYAKLGYEPGHEAQTVEAFSKYAAERRASRMPKLHIP